MCFLSRFIINWFLQYCFRCNYDYSDSWNCANIKFSTEKYSFVEVSSLKNNLLCIKIPQGIIASTECHFLINLSGISVVQEISNYEQYVTNCGVNICKIYRKVSNKWCFYLECWGKVYWIQFLKNTPKHSILILALYFGEYKNIKNAES